MLDDFIAPEPWSDELRAALENLEQGDVVDGLPFGYYARSDSALTLPGRDLPVGGIRFANIDPEDAPTRAILTSQTCDIGEEDAREPRMPWVKVAPVFVIAEPSANDRLAIESWSTYRVRLTGAAFRDAYWVADLRIEVPIDKGALLNLAVEKGFVVEDRRRFADYLAARANRAALPSDVHIQVEKHLRRHFERNPDMASRARNAGLREIRIRVGIGTPISVTVYIFMKRDGSEEQLRKVFNHWLSIATPKAAANGVNIDGFEVVTMTGASAETYVSSSPVRWD